LKAVVYRGVKDLEVSEVPDPELEEEDDAVVRITTAGICGSDLHFYHGKAPLSPGETIGHEGMGIVEKAGPGVTRFREGDRVVVAFDIVCGKCWFCRRGQTQLCEDFANLGAGAFGGSLGGTQAELVRVPHADVNLLPVPGGMEDERAIFVGDILTTGYYAAALSEIGPEDTVAVVGSGPVGFFCVQGARVRGAARVLALDMEAERLALAEKAGATAIDLRERHPHTAVADATEGRGADIVIEAVGTPSGFETAVDCARRGGTVTIAGMYAGEIVELPMGPYWARTLRLQFTGICPVHAWWERAMEAVAAGDIDPLPVISHTLPLEDALHGYRIFDSREATKVLLKP
jgi:threonine dehydrogenase-like Zn-dependent dehydrogenase